MQTRVLPFSDAAIAEAARLVLAGDATNAEAIARIYEAKGRPSFNPLIVHVSSMAKAERIGSFDDSARSLAGRHWPGPLTLVVPLKQGAPIAALVTAGLPTVGLRIPAHPAMQALLRAVSRPLAAPSAVPANGSGASSSLAAQAGSWRSASGRRSARSFGRGNRRSLDFSIEIYAQRCIITA